MSPSVLFVHNGSPGRFSFLARALVQRGWRLALINGSTGRDLPNVRTIHWQTGRGSTKGIFGPATRAEADLIRGYAAAQCAWQLKGEGFEPDVIIGHPGWGEMIFLGEVFPDAKQIQLAEFYYQTQKADVAFDPEFSQVDNNERIRVHAKNMGLALSYTSATRLVVPTAFQASLLPDMFQPRVSVIHEGVDTASTRPIAEAQFRLDENLVLDRTKPVVTFVNRFFEPMRGFHIFMRALPHLLAALPEVHVLLIGSDAPQGYGKPPPEGRTWKQIMLSEINGRLDMSRVHFTGQLSYDRLLMALSISAAHVYLTYPFVLSWSLLDAMACECLVIGSDTAPVREVIKPQVNGLLVDFFEVEALAAAVVKVCTRPQRYEQMRRAARQTVLNEYDRHRKCEPAWLALIDGVLSGP